MDSLIIKSGGEMAPPLKERPSEGILLADKVAIFLLALCPVLQHYKGIFINAAVSVLIVLFPYVLTKIITTRYIRIKNIRIVLPLILFYFFQVIDHGTTVTESGQAIIFFFYVIAIAEGCFSTSYFLKVVYIVSITASILIIIQYICYYILHFHLQLVPTSLLLDRSSQWIMLAKTGRYSITGKIIKFYRPSAFFLEPSHMFIYMFTPATSAVLSFYDKRTKRMALLLIIGMLLSTSGMGVLTAILLYVFYVGKANGKTRKNLFQNLFGINNFIRLSFFIVLSIIAYYKVPFVHSSVERIFGSGADYTNAVAGRLDSGMRVIRTMNRKEFIIGVQDGLSGITASMSGLNDTLYQYGIIGVILSYAFYLIGVFSLKNEYFWIALLIIVVSFFSQHTHSTMFMIYAVFIFFDGYKKNENKDLGTRDSKRTNKPAYSKKA